ncbi:suppressor of G2 allele of SKP1-like protein [Trichinella spiralis]|uniref:suppressor of G2 allele of SKP1-like protein n=1 Tax=Trichinella spiralis TaxID=6334 RepID=UPI0001EFEECF|nr:suppressor of G2 allele of SKP1-like protein [Trichinella spiralis]
MAFNEQFSSVKFDWYQSDETVTVTVKVNDVNKDDLTVEFGLKFLHLQWKKCDTPFMLNLDLSAEIIPDQSHYKETEEIEKEDSSTLNGFFQKLYDDCDDDQKRAILKSLVESHGTVLSTDWSEVSKRHVDCRPPEGTEWKKF